MIQTGFEKKQNKNSNGENMDENDIFQNPELLLQEFNY